MFVALPLFLGLGFAVGFGWSSPPLPAWAWGNAQQQWRLALLAATVAALFVSSFAAFFVEVAPRGFMIGVGAFVIGAVAGRWFATHGGETKDRDQLLFLAAAGLFVMLAALEYDTRIFDHLTKFGAGTVDLEFDGAKGGGDAARRTEPDLTRQDFAAFPGAYRLDKALSYLSQLGAWALRDEQYARLFADVSPLPVDAAGFANAVTPETKAFARFGCRDLEYLVAELTLLQKTFRSESELAPEESRLALDLRGLRSSLESGSQPDLKSVQADFKAIQTRTAQQIAAEDKAAEKLAETLKNTRDPEKNRKYTCNPFGARDDFKLDQIDRDVQDTLGATVNKDSFVALAYLTVVTSIVEFALGNGEGAVQLLEREIARQKEAFDKHKDALEGEAFGCYLLSDKDCEAARKARDEVRLDAYRRLVTLTRLENVQDSIMDFWLTGSIPRVRIQTLARMDADYALAVEGVRKKLGPAVSLECPGRTRSGSTAERLLALWTFSQVVSHANRLEMAAFEPRNVRLNPPLRENLDRLADHVLGFDAACAERYGAAESASETKVELAQAAGEYFEAAGANFGDPAGAGEPAAIANAITALCKARKSFSAAAPYTRASAWMKDAADDKASLDAKQAAFSRGAIRLKNEDALNRISDALNKNFTAGDRDKYCPG